MIISPKPAEFFLTISRIIPLYYNSSIPVISLVFSYQWIPTFKLITAGIKSFPVKIQFIKACFPLLPIIFWHQKKTVISPPVPVY